jgi:DNA-binding response OmpR family regulator
MQPADLSPSPAKRLDVLIVEDDIRHALTMGWMLEAMGHTYTIAVDPLAALEIIASLTPDIIMLDIGLPQMSGFQLCQSLRRFENLNKTLIIAQTGWDRPDYRARASEVGFHDYLVKPVLYDALLDKLTGISLGRFSERALFET